MAPKGGNNAKKESGRAKKAENEANRRREAAEANVRTIFYFETHIFLFFQLRHMHPFLGTERGSQVGRWLKAQ